MTFLRHGVYAIYLQLTRQVEVLNDKMVCANADLKADMERWHKNKRRDFRELFSVMADRQIKYYERVSCIHIFSLTTHIVILRKSLNHVIL